MSRRPLFERVAVIGCGLIGGSFALACREQNLVGRIVAAARTKETLALARELGVADETTRDVQQAVSGADLVYLAAPVQATILILQTIGSRLEKGALVTDAGSTKAEICAAAEQAIPGTAEFVGGHPMAGGETSGIRAARPDLFRGAPYFLTTPEGSLSAAVQRFYDLLEHLEVCVCVVTPEEHDRLVSLASHLPHLAAAALMNVVISVDGAEGQVLGSAGRGLRDTTRIAAGSPEMWRDICRTNKQNISDALAAYIETLSFLREDLDAGRWDELYDALRRAAEARRRLDELPGSQTE